MSAAEFDLIKRFFSRCGSARDDVVLGVGDDCALLQPPVDKQLAISTDTLVEGVHFFPEIDPVSLGHKALAVNLSDLAAMGAEPAWASLALTLPQVDSQWLDGFSRGFCQLATQHGVQLVGGDTTQGPLSITVQVGGWVKAGAALRRSGAKIGDLIYVSGALGDAGLALSLHSAEHNDYSPAEIHNLNLALEQPEPRVSEGQALLGLASAAIDVSDGLLADLGHVLARSGGLGATLHLAAIPCSDIVKTYLETTHNWSIPLSSGDDYELCFTVPPSHAEAMNQLNDQFDCGFTCIGAVEAEPGIRCQLGDGSLLDDLSPGFEHFEKN